MQLWLHYLSLPFAGWCFTHQYKNTTQFCFYSGLAATQNTKASKTGHTHDDRYYTEAEINSKLNALNVNTDINFVPTVNSSYLTNTSVYGKKTGKGAAIGYINMIFQTKMDTTQWTRYKILSCPYYCTCAYGFVVNQDNGLCYTIEIDSGSKDVYLRVDNVALPKGSWLRGQAVFLCWG